MRAGILKREVDGTLLQAAFFLGSRAFYRALREMPEPERAKLRMTSVSFVNELYGDEPAKRRARVKARFINNAMMATLLGAVVSDGLEDGRVVSGVGGQYNFVAQSFALEDARSIIMLRAIREADGRTTSNIRWNYGHTTIPRHLRDIVVTEYGIADLRGKTDRDVIAAMLAVAELRGFRPSCCGAPRTPARSRGNSSCPPPAATTRRCASSGRLRPRARADCCRCSRSAPISPRPSSGCIPALALLGAASPMRLAGLLVRGLGPPRRRRSSRDCLARMGLASAASFAEHAICARCCAARSRS